ncbi:hypothetical protein GC173_08145 [bacterium]|nr:hypothetical protein [bacterium]
MKKPCYLRKTEVVLADGQAYAFRALPLTRKTMPIVRALVDDATPDGDKLAALVEAIELSLSYDHTPEAVEELMGSGLVSPGNKEVMNALVAGLA